MGVTMTKILGIVMSVVIVVIGLVLAPIIFDQVNTSVGNGNIANYPGTSDLIKLVPLLYTVGILGLAGGVAYLTFKA